MPRKRNLTVECVIDESKLLNLFWEEIGEQLNFENPESVFNKAKKLLTDSKDKGVATNHGAIARIFACVYVANVICCEGHTQRTIADLGGVTPNIIGLISEEIGSSLDIRHMW